MKLLDFLSKMIRTPIANSTRGAVLSIKTNLIGYEDITRAALLAAVAKEHLLLVGGAGRAKSLFAREFLSNFEGTTFTTQLSAFSQESDVFGLPHIQTLMDKGESVYPLDTPAFNSHWWFIDEIFDSSDVLLRTLLSCLEERKFLRGKSPRDIKLRTCIATANYDRFNELTDAVLDRFLLSVRVPDLTPNQRMKLYEAVDYETIQSRATIYSHASLDEVREASNSVKIGDYIGKVLLDIAAKQQFTPRRERRVAKLMRVNAALNGRNVVDQDDLHVLRWSFPLKTPTADRNVLASDAFKLVRAALQGETQKEEIATIWRSAPPDTAMSIPELNAVAVVIGKLSGINPITEENRQSLNSCLENLAARIPKIKANLGITV